MIINDVESIMYKFVDLIVEAKIPVVFVGALTLKALLNENRIQEPNRSTKDIDCHWTDISHTTDNEVLMSLSGLLDTLNITNSWVELDRKSSHKTSACFGIYINRMKEFTIDLNYNPIYSVTNYVTPNGIVFQGSSKERMFVDKLSVISSKKIYRRTKDLIDLYSLSQIEGFKLSNITKVIESSERNLEDFSDFLISNNEQLIHSYNKLDGIINKPDFIFLYNRIISFCIPFITKSYKNIDGEWKPNEAVWLNNPYMKSSLFN